MVQRVCRVIWADGVAAFAETVRDARLDMRGFSGWQYEQKIFGVALGTQVMFKQRAHAGVMEVERLHDFSKFGIRSIQPGRLVGRVVFEKTIARDRANRRTDGRYAEYSRGCVPGPR